MFLFSAISRPWFAERHRARAKLDEICNRLHEVMHARGQYTRALIWPNSVGGFSSDRYRNFRQCRGTRTVTRPLSRSKQELLCAFLEASCLSLALSFLRPRIKSHMQVGAFLATGTKWRLGNKSSERSSLSALIMNVREKI